MCVLALCLALVMIVTVASYLLVERPFVEGRAASARGTPAPPAVLVDAAA
jgi:peptidoglycan/LPS O-acetylase OafA/YrhL